MKKSQSSKKATKKNKITLEGSVKIFNASNSIHPEDWKIGNIGFLHCLSSDYDVNHAFLVGENGIPIFFGYDNIPLSFTEKTTNASSFYASYQFEEDEDAKEEDFLFSVEIGPEDNWVIEQYGKGLPNNMHFEMLLGELKRTIFHLDPPKQIFETHKIKEYAFKRTLSYEEIIILGRYFKDPSKGYSYQFTFTYPYSKENNDVYEMHSDGRISSNLPKGWVMGVYKIFKEKNKTKGIVDYFGSKVNKKKAFNFIQSMYEDAEDISFEGK